MKDAYSLNNTICGRKSSPSVDEKLAKCLNRNGQNKNKEKKPKTEERDIPSRGSSTASPLRSLTPSLDPELLRQFEEEDRPRRVLRSSTATASTPKAAVTDATFPNVTKVIKSGFTVKMAAKKSATRKSIPEKSRRKKSENPSTNFVGDKTFPLGTIFCSAPLNEGEKRKRSRSKDGSKEKQLHNKILRTDIDELLDDELVIALEDLRSTPMRPRRWSAASSSRASTSSASNGFTVITKMERRRGLSRARRSSFNSNWKLIGAPYESSVYIDICYPQAVHSKTGDLLRLRDSVRVNSIDGEPNFACICRLFNDPKTGAPLASILWYYTPMQVKVDNTLIPPIFERELFASKHMDIIPLDTVDEIVWVLTYNEYGRFMAETRNDAYPLAQRVSEEDLLWKKGEDDYPRRTYLPRDDTPLEVVYFCRRIYDCKQQKVETKKTSEKNNQMKRLRRQSWKYRTKRHR
uniref:BAH domain-containing protein n=1 Tax=Setaria digitata TaxID=48799 RepID=A0A915PH50_9BILA